MQVPRCINPQAGQPFRRYFRYVNREASGRCAQQSLTSFTGQGRRLVHLGYRQDPRIPL